MFHPLFFHNGLHSCHCHDVLADAMALAAAFKAGPSKGLAGREGMGIRSEIEHNPERCRGERER